MFSSLGWTLSNKSLIEKHQFLLKLMGYNYQLGFW